MRRGRVGFAVLLSLTGHFHQTCARLLRVKIANGNRDMIIGKDTGDCWETRTQRFSGCRPPTRASL